MYQASRLVEELLSHTSASIAFGNATPTQIPSFSVGRFSYLIRIILYVRLTPLLPKVPSLAPDHRFILKELSASWSS
jgi:hypothetical protein